MHRNPGSSDTATGTDDRRLMIDMREVGKTFSGHPVLVDMTLQVAAGEMFGLIGPSGSGKTTTMHLCCGHLRPTRGQVTVSGEQPTAFTSTTRRRLGYMPQNFILYPDLTVYQNVAFAAGLYGMSERRCRGRIREVLELVELGPAHTKTARTISGGMQRRLALAAMLVHDPHILFADEPTANLDPMLRAKLWTHFRQLAQRGRTLLITTQYIDEAEYCDRVGLMFRGRLIAEGRPDALRRQAFGGDMIDVTLADAVLPYIPALAAVEDVRAVAVRQIDALRITVDQADQAIPPILSTLTTAGAVIRSLAPYRPTFDEVFIRLIEQHRGARPPIGQIQTSAAAEGV